jgi:hypothetical protein
MRTLTPRIIVASSSSHSPPLAASLVAMSSAPSLQQADSAEPAQEREEKQHQQRAASHSHSPTACPSVLTSQPPDGPAQSLPSSLHETTSAAPAATASHAQAAVVIEDVTARKRCSHCQTDLPIKDFTGSQLKKGGARVCIACVQQKAATTAAQTEAEKKMASEAQKQKQQKQHGPTKKQPHPPAASSVPAAASAAASSPPQPEACSSSSSSAAGDSSPAREPLLRCCICRSSCDSQPARSCKLCQLPYCSKPCRKQHQAEQKEICRSRATKPKYELAQEDRLTRAELTAAVEGYRRILITELQTDQLNDQHWRNVRVDLATMLQFDERPVLSALDLTTLDVQRPWWLNRGKPSLALIDAALLYFIQLQTSVGLLWALKDSKSSSDDMTTPELAYTGGLRMETPKPRNFAIEDRVMEKMLRYFLFYYRHVDRSLLDADVREYLHVDSDQRGTIPYRNSNCKRMEGMLYITDVKDGRLRLLRWKPPCSSPSAAAIGCGSSQGYNVPTRAGEIIQEPGLVIDVAWIRLTSGRILPALTRIHPYPGTDQLTSEPLTYSEMTEAGFQTRGRELLGDQWQLVHQMRQRDPFKLGEYLLEVTGSQPSISIAGSEIVHEFRFLPLPRIALESATVELLLMESILEEAQSGNMEAQLLLQHVEEQSGQTIEEVIADKRAEMERMIAEQMSERRRIEERAELRQRQLKRLTAPAAASGTSSSASPASSREEPKSDQPSAWTPPPAAAESKSDLLAAPTSLAPSSSSSSALAPASSSLSSSSPSLAGPRVSCR